MDYWLVGNMAGLLGVQGAILLNCDLLNFIGSAFGLLFLRRKSPLRLQSAMVQWTSFTTQANQARAWYPQELSASSLVTLI